MQMTVVIAEIEDDLIKRLNEWKDFVENIGMRVNLNKSKVMISGEWQKAVKWPCGVCDRGTGNNYLRQRRRLCFLVQSVCLSVLRITRKLVNGF